MNQFFIKSPANTLGAGAFLGMALFLGQAWAAVGYVHEVSGSVFMAQRSGAERAVAMGQTFEPGATFRTGADGILILKFEDGQLTTLRPDSSFRVDQYSWNPKNPASSNSAFTLLTGALRFVSGLVGSTNPGNVRIASSTATIGIRGTDLVFDSAGNAFVLVGGIDLTGRGTPPILIPVGNFASVVTNRTPGPVTGAPGLFRATADQLASFPLPANAPTGPLATAVAAARAKAAAQTARANATAAARNATALLASPNPTTAAAAAAEAARLAVVAAQAAATAAAAEAAVIGAALTAMNAAIAAGAKPAVAPAPADKSSAAAALASRQRPDVTAASVTAALLAGAKEAAAAADAASAAVKAAQEHADTSGTLAKQAAAPDATLAVRQLAAAKALALAGAAFEDATIAALQQTVSTNATTNMDQSSRKQLADRAARGVSQSNATRSRIANVLKGTSLSEVRTTARLAIDSTGSFATARTLEGRSGQEQDAADTTRTVITLEPPPTTPVTTIVSGG